MKTSTERDDHALEHEFEKEALLPEIQRRLAALDVEGAVALTEGLSAPGQLFMAGFAQGFTAGMNALSSHLHRLKGDRDVS